jgi:regulator of RNase E activity RraA
MPTEPRDGARKELGHGDLLRLKRWNTPTIYNGWERITRRDPAADGFNPEETRDFMPQMGPMVGRAVTVVVEPSNPAHARNGAAVWSQYRRYVASRPGPKVVVVQDLDKPRTAGAFWGEVNANIHRALGCVGTITDGAVRDLDEMTDAGFKALARRLCVGHAHSTPVRWGCEVEVFGRRVSPGQLIHADKHGFLAIPSEDEADLLEAAARLDSAECRTLIAAARGGAGLTAVELLSRIDSAADDYRRLTAEHFARRGEW